MAAKAKTMTWTFIQENKARKICTSLIMEEIQSDEWVHEDIGRSFILANHEKSPEHPTKGETFAYFYADMKNHTHSAMVIHRSRLHRQQQVKD